MENQALEQMLETAPVLKQEGTYNTVDVYAKGTLALYTPPLKIFDMPSGDFQIHIHGSADGDILYNGSIVEMGTNRTLLKLNGYDCSMLDLLYGSMLGLDNKIDPNR